MNLKRKSAHVASPGIRNTILHKFSGNLFFSAIRDPSLTSTVYVISLESSWEAREQEKAPGPGERGGGG